MKQKRRSIRMKGYDYSLAGAYFVTMVAIERACLFGKIIHEKCVLNQIGKIVNFYWKRLPNFFPYIQLGDFVIMPNHLHAIIWLLEIDKHNLRSTPNISHDNLHFPKGTLSGSLGAVIQNYKSISTRAVNQMRQTPGKKVWQRNYHDRIIRNERELDAIREYILSNPLNWERDSEFTS